MGWDKDCFNTLFEFLEEEIKKFPDNRTGENNKYEIRDAVLSGFSVFFTQSPSFLQHQAMMERNKGNNNGRTIFGIHKLPKDNQIRTN